MPGNFFEIENRVVVLTGGLGQLGRQFTSAVLELGGKVAVFDVGSQNVPEDTSHRSYKDRLCVFTVDVTSRKSIEAGLAQVNSKWGVPHALINAAALDSPPGAAADENGPFETYPEISWDKVINVNLKGVFLCCQVIGGSMAKAGRGSIVNIGSIYGVVSPDQRIYNYRAIDGAAFFKPVAYSASKSGLLNLTRYLSTYWAERNVRVNMLTLGGVFNNQDDEFLNGYCARVPMGRMAREDEYNGAVIFLISDASAYMTGSNLIIDGGWTAW